MTPSRLTDSGSSPPASAPEDDEDLVEVAPRGAGPNADGADVETRHRLRRALRILLAARRRDDGGRRIDS
jgi:hypothetical protein